MNLRRTLAKFAILCCTCYIHAEIIGTLAKTDFGQVKFENGLIITWQLPSTDVAARQINVFTQEGRPLASLNLLRLVPDAGRVSIYDVSARPDGMIAVAAVYRKAGTRHTQPLPTMLLFDHNGQFLSAFRLENSRTIERLEIDDKSNIWTVTSYSGNKQPSTVPMVVEYAQDGTIAKELLTRDKFPFHAESIQDGPLVGPMFMGYDSAGLWFWLPGSTELVTISVEDGRSTIVRTQLPHRAAGDMEHPLGVVRDTSGVMVAQFREAREGGVFGFSNYTWSAANGWLPFDPGLCKDALLVGASERGLVYVQQQRGSGQGSICTSQIR